MRGPLDYNPAEATQGGLPWLLDHLWGRFCRKLRRAAKQRRQPLAVDQVPAEAFLKWARRHLERCRVVETFPLDANVGVRLQDNTMCSICPGVDHTGTMEDAGDVPITQGRSQANQRGVQPGGAVGI